MENVDIIKGVIIPYINFAVFLGLAVFFFRKQLAAAMIGRRESFLKQFEKASLTRKDAEEKFQEAQKRLASIEAEISKMKSDAVSIAQAEAKKVIEDANRLAGVIKEEAKRSAEAELQQAKLDLENQIVALVTKNVEQKLKTSLTKEDHLKILGRQEQTLQAMRLQ